LIESFLLPKKAERIIVLQRIELASQFLKKLRKILGRYFFTNIVTRFFLNPKKISTKYYDLMKSEFLLINKYIHQNDKTYLSIGGGLGGLEVIVNSVRKDINFYFIERNYVSKKIVYGWGGEANREAYNNFELQENFLKINGFNFENFSLVDYDLKKFPLKKFDLVVSLFSLDYHYDFSIYHEYLKKISNDNTRIIFDTIRPDYFKDIFSKVIVINTNHDTVHKSKRIVCTSFIK
jgi:hypothetical protein